MSAVTKRLAQVALGILASAVILFAAAGRLDWLWAWVYVGLSVAIVAVNALLLLPRHRDVIAERAGEGEGAKRWDKWVGGMATLLASVVTLLVAGLDARLGWTSELPLRNHVVGVACWIAGYGLFTWAMATNRFFSTFVRIQKDRGHAVVDTGPSRAVRHPGYVGWIVTALATPLLLGSIWALAPGALGATLMIVRTALEDRTLRRELDGYEDYATRVRFRLLPGVW
jgi:protein-S-isoprenylcysteine O-methyltransferase Ste14